MANRAVTNGCAASSYCGDASVSRMQMAQFLSRLGAAMTPAVLRAEIASATFGQGQVVCQTSDHAVGASARSALVRTRITARTPSGASVLRSSAVMSVDNGQRWSSLTLDGGAAAKFSAAGAATLTDYAAVDLSPGQHVRFGIALGGTAFSIQGASPLSAELVNRDRDAAPF